MQISESRCSGLLSKYRLPFTLPSFLPAWHCRNNRAGVINVGSASKKGGLRTPLSDLASLWIQELTSDWVKWTPYDASESGTTTGKATPNKPSNVQIANLWMVNKFLVYLHVHVQQYTCNKIMYVVPSTYTCTQKGSLTCLPILLVSICLSWIHLCSNKRNYIQVS